MIRRTTPLLTAGIVTTALILGACSDAESSPSAGSDEDQIRATVQEFGDAANRLDAEGFVAQVCSQYAGDYPIDQLETQLGFILAFSGGGITFEVTNIQVDGETATGDLALTAKSPDANPDPPSETHFVLEDGKWKICEPNGDMMESGNE